MGGTGGHYRKKKITFVLSDGVNEVTKTYEILVKPAHPPKIDVTGLVIPNGRTVAKVGARVTLSFETVDEDIEEQLRFFVTLGPGVRLEGRPLCHKKSKKRWHCEAFLKALAPGRHVLVIDAVDPTGAKDTKTQELEVSGVTGEWNATITRRNGDRYQIRLSFTVDSNGKVRGGFGGGVSGSITGQLNGSVLSGRWKRGGQRGTYRVTFAADGTFSGRWEGEGGGAVLGRPVS